MRMLKLVLAVGALSLGGGESIAQELRECAKDGSCVEFTVRYYRDEKDAYKRVQIIDTQTKKPVEKVVCQIGTSCKLSGDFKDLTTLSLMQTYNPHYCYQVCYGGWCYIKCPSH